MGRKEHKALADLDEVQKARATLHIAEAALERSNTGDQAFLGWGVALAATMVAYASLVMAGDYPAWPLWVIFGAAVVLVLIGACLRSNLEKRAVAVVHAEDAVAALSSRESSNGPSPSRLLLGLLIWLVLRRRGGV